MKKYKTGQVRCELFKQGVYRLFIFPLLRGPLYRLIPSCSLCYNKHEFADEIVGGARGAAADYRAVLMPW